MNIGLFASGKVGLEIAGFLRQSSESIVCLALDARGDALTNKAIADASGVPPDRIFHSDTLYQPERLAELQALSPDLFVLSWWPYIVKKDLIDIPRIGCLNFHPSLLPYNRGKHYNFWTLVEDTPFGVTIHFVNDGVDSGDIAFQARIDKSWEDTGETLYYKAQEEIVRLFKESFPIIQSGRIPRAPQDASQGSFHLGRELDSASQIDLEKRYSARDLLNLLRARTFPPHPAAWFIDGNEKYEVRVSIRRIPDPED
ncbi:MAG TPA: formyltransferase family protein [Terriglobia bacterium]|nr:formyltransferase family protein [Terriglobia bacterium]